MTEINRNYLENYEKVASEIKFITNSLIRLKLLKTLYYRPHSMKEINSETNLSYSSISSNVHGLEAERYVYRELNQYYASNVTRLFLSNIIDLNKTLDILNNYFNFFDGHIVDKISKKSIKEFYLLEKAELIETNGNDIYKTYNEISTHLNNAKSIKGIFPYSYYNFPDLFNQLIEKNIKIEVLFPNKIFDIIINKIKLSNENVKISKFNDDLNYLLIITNEAMILGLFKEEESFDQNRLLISVDKDAIKWGNDLFKNFKKEKEII